VTVEFTLDDEAEYYSVTRFAKKFRVCNATVYRMIARGELSFVVGITIDSQPPGHHRPSLGGF
jgi:hypothetical protein